MYLTGDPQRGPVAWSQKIADVDLINSDGPDVAVGDGRWQKPVSYSAMRLDVHRPSGLLISGEDGYVTGIDPRTGSERWSIDASAPYDAAWILAGDVILCSRGTVVLGTTGEKLWTHSAFQPQGHLAHPLGDGLLCYEAGRTVPVDLVCRSAHTGEVRWRTPFTTAKPDPYDADAFQPLEELVSDTTVFLPSAAGSRRKPTAVDGRTGEPRWTYGTTYDEVDLAYRGTRSVPGGFILSTGSGTVCLATDNGRKRWHSETRNVHTTGAYALLSRTGQARVLQHWTSVRIVGVRHGRTLWSGQFDATAMSEPSVSGEQIVVLDGGGTLWALRV